MQGGGGVFEALSAHAKSLQNNPIFVNNLTKIGLSNCNGDDVVRKHDKNCNNTSTLFKGLTQTGLLI